MEIQDGIGLILPETRELDQLHDATAFHGDGALISMGLVWALYGLPF